MLIPVYFSKLHDSRDEKQPGLSKVHGMNRADVFRQENKGTIDRLRSVAFLLPGI